MKKRVFPASVTVAAFLFIGCLATRAADGKEAQAEGKWSGVDETVVEKFAEQAGRPARDPYINVGEGDMLLFCFLVAGAVGGFVLGYNYRRLFREEPRAAE